MKDKNIKDIITVLNSGGLILYPTDTIWGIGCDATNQKAVEKVYFIKKRKNSKALISLTANKEQLTKYTKYIPKEAENKSPTTIIYNKIDGLAKNLLAKDGSAAIRIVQDKFCKELILQFGKPIVSTSANISGQKNPSKFSEITNEIINNIDYIVNLRKHEIMSHPSSILKLTVYGNIQKIR